MVKDCCCFYRAGQEGPALGDENYNIVNEMFNETPHTFAEDTRNFSYGSNRRRKPPKRKQKKLAAECYGVHSLSDGV